MRRKVYSDPCFLFGVVGIGVEEADEGFGAEVDGGWHVPSFVNLISYIPFVLDCLRADHALKKAALTPMSKSHSGL